MYVLYVSYLTFKFFMSHYTQLCDIAGLLILIDHVQCSFLELIGPVLMPNASNIIARISCPYSTNKIDTAV